MIDLVMAVLLCGVLAAFFRGRWANARPELLFPVAFAIGLAWFLLRSRRTGPTCSECGNRFFSGNEKLPATHCPHCGEPSTPRRTRSPIRTAIYWILAPAVALFFVAVLILGVDAARSITPLDPGRLPGMLVIPGGILATAIVITWLSSLRSPRPRAERMCEACGGLIPAKPAIPTICPNCRHRKLSHDEMKKEHAKGYRLLALILGVVVIAGLAFVANVVYSMFSKGNWSALPAILLAAILPLFFVWKLAQLLIRSRRISGILGEDAALATARCCAGVDGTVTKLGTSTVWYSGPDDPVPLLCEEIAESHRRVLALLGETDIPDPTLTILCFAERDALLKFYKQIIPNADLSEHMGLFLQQPWSVMMFCTDKVAGRMDTPRSLARSLCSAVLLERVIGALPAPWLQSGITQALAVNWREGALVSLNRRVLSALGGELEWSEDLFTTSVSKMSKVLLRKSAGPGARRSEQFGDQAWSIVEFLAGEHAPAARKTAFRAFLKDKQFRSRHGQAFFQHFGFGFGSLLEDWREWVKDQGIGAEITPPPDIREAVENRVLPVIRDQSAPRADRMQAIRNWRQSGTRLGAQTLIDLLRNPGDIPKEEIIWSLRRVSAMTWDDDPDRWQSWWNSLSSTQIDQPVTTPS